MKIITADLANQSVEEIAGLLAEYDTVISAVSATGLLDQLKLVDAAAKAGTKRFIPSGFTSVSPPGGEMKAVRTEKEKVHERIWYHHLPYTIIDSGVWYQISFPTLPSGRVDYAFMGEDNTIVLDGNAPNLMIDKRDIGRLTARIVKDKRTLNKRVFLHAAVLTQNDIWNTMEERSGEKIRTKYVSRLCPIFRDNYLPWQATGDELVAKMHAARKAYTEDLSDPVKRFATIRAEYMVCKYVRQDNSPENARYLGYLDTRELYPDFEPKMFSAFVDELIAGNAKQLYRNKVGVQTKHT